MNATTENTTAAVAAPGASGAPKGAKATRKTTTKKNAPKAKAKKASTRKTAATRAAAPGVDSKKATVLDMLRAKGGATMTELRKKTGWMPHSVRGFLSGTVGKKMGLKVERTTNDGKESVYRIAK